MKNKVMKLIIEGKVKRVSDNENTGLAYEIDSSEKYRVRIFPRNGRRLITCSCENGTKYCNSPAICSHKVAALFYWLVFDEDIPKFKQVDRMDSWIHYLTFEINNLKEELKKELSK